MPAWRPPRAEPEPFALDERPLFVVLALIVVSALPFWGARFGDFVWDDRWLISENPRLRDGDYLWQSIRHPFPYGSTIVGWAQGMYRPVLSAAYGVAFRLFGLETFGYHLLNLALNAACVGLLFLWLRRRFAEDEPGVATSLAAAAGAALFATHPSHTESVAWISGSSDLWACLFGLLAMTAWDRTRGAAGAFLVAALCVLSFYSKETGLMFPVALVLDDRLRGGSAGRARLHERAGVLTIVLATAILVRSVVLAGHSSAVFEGVGRSLVAVSATFGGYLRLTFWPWPPSTQVGYLAATAAGARSYPPWAIALGASGLVALAVLAIGAWRRPRLRPWLADAVWFVVPLLPVLNLLEMNSEYYVFERSLYISTIGWAAAAARVLLRTTRAAAGFRWAAGAAIASLLVVDAGWAAIHARHFDSDVALWSSEAREGHVNPKVATNLAKALTRVRRFQEAKDAARAGTSGMIPGVQVELMNDWMDADFQLAVSGAGGAIAEVRRYHDEIAGGRDPEGEVRHEWDAAGPEARERIRRSVYFLLRRALAAMAMGDFDAASAQLESIHSNGMGVDDPVQARLIVALAGRGAFDEAAQRLAREGAALGPDGARLGRLLVEARQAAASALPTSERQRRLAHAFAGASEWMATVAVADRALASAGLTDEARTGLLIDRLTAEVFLGRTAAIRLDADALRRIDPRLAPDLNALVAQTL